MAGDLLASELKNFTKSEEELDVIAQSQSFWDVGNYRRVVKRIDDGARLTTDLSKMVQERAEIEAKYVKQLQHWSKKWEDSVMKGPEYGTVETGWKSSCQEAARLANIHEDCLKKLEDIYRTITEWKSNRYHKSLGNWKETKKSEDNFQKAQKPWARCISKTNKAKKTYHQLAKEQDSLVQQVSAAENSRDMPAEQFQKLKDKRDKCSRDKDRAREKYIESIDDLQHCRKHYVEDMIREFDKCQVFERQRMEFFHNMLVSLKSSMDISGDDRLKCIYQVLDHSLSQVNPEEDLQWYAQAYGTGMSYNWPEFEEYFSAHPHTSRPQVTTPPNANSSPVLYSKLNAGSARSLDTQSQGSKGSVDTPPTASLDNSHIYECTNALEWQEPPPSSPTDEEPDYPVSDDKPAQQEDEEEEEYEGTLMRAAYDYEKQDDDDLGFKEGDIIRIVEHCDGGWAKGLLDGKFGYVPASYFEPV